MKKILITEIKRHIVIIIVGLMYLGLVMVSNVRLPCPFNLVTGLLCPSCGITRMFADISILNFKGAFLHNPVIFVTLPLLAVVYVIYLVGYIKSGERKLNKGSKIIIIAEIVVLISYGIIRNLS